MDILIHDDKKVYFKKEFETKACKKCHIPTAVIMSHTVSNETSFLVTSNSEYCPNCGERKDS